MWEFIHHEMVMHKESHCSYITLPLEKIHPSIPSIIVIFYSKIKSTNSEALTCFSLVTHVFFICLDGCSLAGGLSHKHPGGGEPWGLVVPRSMRTDSHNRTLLRRRWRFSRLWGLKGSSWVMAIYLRDAPVRRQAEQSVRGGLREDENRDPRGSGPSLPCLQPPHRRCNWCPASLQQKSQQSRAGQRLVWHLLCSHWRICFTYGILHMEDLTLRHRLQPIQDHIFNHNYIHIHSNRI